jgi:hypothetical protein
VLDHCVTARVEDGFLSAIPTDFEMLTAGTSEDIDYRAFAPALADLVGFDDDPIANLCLHGHLPNGVTVIRFSTFYGSATGS